MTSVAQQYQEKNAKRPEHRASFGRDILSRMLLLEKQSKSRPSISAASDHSPMGSSRRSTQASIGDAAAGSSASPAAASHASRSSPAAMLRTQTLPNLPLAGQIPKPPPPPVRTSPHRELTEEEKSEICLSPSWSDFGGAKRKKERKRREKEQRRLEEERKVTQKGIKKELEKQKVAMIKEQKRLNKKPPPAAMDTQRMPAALRRNSVSSIRSFLGSDSPQDTTQVPSEDRQPRARRWSFGSSRSKHSNSASSDDEGPPSPPNWQPVVSPNAPQLPKLTVGWHSRNASSSSDRTGSRGSGDGQGKDFFKMAYRLDTKSTLPDASKAIPTQTWREETPDVMRRRRRSSSSGQDPLRLRGIPRSQTDSQLPALVNASSAIQPTKDGREGDVRNGASIVPTRRRTESLPRIQQSPSLRARELDANRADNHRRVSIDKLERPPMNPLTAHPVEASRPRDGGSYCHKQRMYEQQRSIQGYEDEQAVIAANLPEAANESIRTEQAIQPEPMSIKPVLSNHSHAVLDRPRPPKLKGTNAVKSAKIQIHESPIEVESATASLPPLTPMDPPSELRSRKEASKARASKEITQDLEKSTPKSPREAYADSQRGSKFKTSPPRKSKQTEILQRSPVPHRAHSSTSPPPSLPPNKPLESPTVYLRPHEIERASLDPAAPAEYEYSDRRRTVGDAVMMSPPNIANHSRTRTSSSQLLFDPGLQPKKAERFPSSTSTQLMDQPSSPRSQPNLEEPAVTDARHAVLKEVVTKPPIPMSRQATDPGPDYSKDPEPIPTKPNAPQVIVSTTTGEGVVRKTSIKRPRSNPQLNTLPPPPALPSFDFLPQLKHQPLPKPKRQSQSPQRPTNIALKTSAQDFPLPPASSPTTNGASPTSDLRIQPRSPLRLGAPSPTSPSSSSPSSSTIKASDIPQPPPAAVPRHRPAPVSNMSNSSKALTSRNSAFGPLSTGRGAAGGLEAKPLAKLFVICCKCKFWHDLPSKLYAAMSAPQMLSRDIVTAAAAVPSAKSSQQQQQQPPPPPNGHDEGWKGYGKGNSGGVDAEKAGNGTGTGTGTGMGMGMGIGVGQVKTEQAQLDTMVKCPWCEHLMTTWCCAGWTTVVYLHERHH